MERKINKNPLGTKVQNKQQQQMKIKDQLTDLQQTIANIISQFLVLQLKDPQIIEQHLQKIVKQFLLQQANHKIQQNKKNYNNENRQKLEHQLKSLKLKYPKLQQETVYIETETKIANFVSMCQNFVKKGQEQNQLLFDIESLENVYMPTTKKVQQILPFLKFIHEKQIRTIKVENRKYFKANLTLSIDKVLQRLYYLFNKILSTALILDISPQYSSTITNYQIKMEKTLDFLRQQYENVQKKQKQIKQGQRKSVPLLNKQQLDIVFIISANKTMKTTLQRFKGDFKKLTKRFQQLFPKSQIKYAFVMYAEHSIKKPEDQADIKKVNFNTAQSIQRYIQNISNVYNKLNQAQAVYDGLYSVKKLDWRQNSTKFAFLLFDAPPHGKQYSNYEDSFPKGCPCSITLTEIADYYNSNNINICLKLCGPKIGKTIQVFQNAFNKHLLNISKMDQSKLNSLAQEVHKKILKIEQDVNNRENFIHLSKDILKSMQKQYQIKYLLDKMLQEVKENQILSIRLTLIQQIKNTPLNLQIKVENEIKKIVNSLLPEQNRIFTETITHDIISIFRQNQTNPKIIKSKIDTFNKKFLEYQAKIIAPVEIGEKKKGIAQRIYLLQKEIQEKITKIKKFAPLKIKQFIQQNAKSYEKLKERMKIKQKWTFQTGQNQNTIKFSCQGLDINTIKATLNDAVKNHPFIKIKINQIVQNLRGGASKTFTFQIELADLKTRLINLNDRISRIITVLKNVQQNKYAWAIAEEHLENLIKIFQAFEYKKQEIEDLMNFGSQIDLVIVMDTTGSMEPHLDKAKKDSREIIRKFKEKYKTSSVNYAFVSYKDHCDKKVVETFNFDNPENIQKKIKDIQAIGGGDAPQAVHDGLFAVKQLNWREKSTKFVFMIYDAPPHGKQYGYQKDDYPNGCPCGITLKKIADYYNKTKIHINLLKCGSDVGKTEQIFQRAFNAELFNVSELENYDAIQSVLEQLKKKMKLLQALVNEKQKQFAEITNKIIYEIQKDVQKIIKENQQLKTLENYQKKLIQYKDYFNSVETNKLQTNMLQKKTQDIKPLSKDARIAQIQKKWGQILQVSSQAQKLKEKNKYK